MFWLVSALKAVTEVAALSMVAQWVVGLFAPSTRHRNPIYQLFGVITSPVHKFVRRLAPKMVLDSHIPLLSVLAVVAIWVVLTLLKISLARAL